MLTIDGSKGEGGGQVLRTSLSLSALTGRPFRLEHIRAGRSKPGLRPQHLTAVRAAAAVCQAELSGDEIDSRTLEFRPQSKPQGGEYTFDVRDAAPRGLSAGSMTLVLQTLLWPLLFAETESKLILRGGTHVPFSPSFDYVNKVGRPNLARFGVDFDLELQKWGWMPKGEGEFTAVIRPLQKLEAVRFSHQPIETVQGEAVVTNLPGHIPHRMSRRAYNLLTEAGLHAAVQALRLKSEAPGAATLLWLPQAGFSSLGEKGKAAQTVAEEAVRDLLAFERSQTAVDLHLADQLLIPMALAQGVSYFSTEALSLHTLTNAALLQQWLEVDIHITGSQDHSGTAEVHGMGFSR